MKFSRWVTACAVCLWMPAWALAVPVPSPSPAGLTRPELKELTLTFNLAERVREAISKGTTLAAYAKQMTLLMPQLDDVLYGMRHTDPLIHRNFAGVKDHYQAAWEVWEARAQRPHVVASDYLPIFDRQWEEQVRRFPGIRSGVRLQDAPGGGKMVFLPDILNWHWRRADVYLDTIKTLLPKAEAPSGP